MSNKLIEINIKTFTQCFSDAMKNIKNLIQIKSMQMETYTKILTYYIGYVTVKDLSYVKTNTVNPLYFITDKINGYIERKQWK